MESPLRGKGFTQIEMVELAEALLEYLPINMLEWERLQREKHLHRSISTLKQKWRSMLNRQKSFDSTDSNIMTCPLELTHVPKILKKMKQKKRIVRGLVEFFLVTHNYFTWKRWRLSISQWNLTIGVGFLK